MANQLTLKDDIVFKIFFSKAGHEKYLKSFLEALLNIPIKKVEIVQEASLKQLSIKDKMGRLDIKATINDESIVDIEMQVRDEHNIEKRSTFYGSRLISEQLSSKEKYEEIKPVILINILNYEFLEVPEYHTETVTVAKKHREYEIVKDIKYHFIELPKFRKQKPELENALECWLALIDYKDKGLIKMAEEKEQIIKEAKEDFEEILTEGALKEIIEFRESAERDEASAKYWAEKKGIEKGKINIAKKMLKQGMTINLIMQITELSKKEIEKVIKEEFGESLTEGEIKEIVEFRESAERDEASAKYWTEKKVKTNIAKKMLEQGMKVDLIMQITELPKEEIETIRNKI